MNKEQRDQLTRIQKDLLNLQQELEDIRDDEQAKFDNLSEGLQASEKGEKLQQAADNSQEAIDSLDSASASVQEAIDKCDEIAE